MSRLQEYFDSVSNLKEVYPTKDQTLAFLLGELNTTLAMIADHLDKIEKDHKALIREVGKRRP